MDIQNIRARQHELLLRVFITVSIAADNERKQLRSTLLHWSEQTCVRFSELGVNEHYEGNHIIFTHKSNG